MAFSRREKTLLILVLACVGLLAADRLLVTPLSAVWSTRGARIVELKAKLAEGGNLVNRKDALSRRWEQLVARSLPLEASAAEDQVLKAVNGWVVRSGLKNLTLKPRWDGEQKEAPRLELRVSGEGDLAAVARFIYELERDSLAARIEKLDVSARDEGGRLLALDLTFSSRGLAN